MLLEKNRLDALQERLAIAERRHAGAQALADLSNAQEVDRHHFRSAAEWKVVTEYWRRIADKTRSEIDKIIMAQRNE